jgi:hypothetical protein
VTGLIKREQNASDIQAKKEMDENMFLRLLDSDLPLTHEVKAKILNMSISNYYYKLRKYQDKKDMFAD